MKLTARIPVTASLLALLLITATGCNRLKARDQLTKGVQAFKNDKETHHGKLLGLPPPNRREDRGLIPRAPPVTGR